MNYKVGQLYYHPNYDEVLCVHKVNAYTIDFFVPAFNYTFEEIRLGLEIHLNQNNIKLCSEVFCKENNDL